MQHIIEHRQEKDRFFKNSPESPLTPAQREHFEALNYYAPNEALVLTLPIEAFSEKMSFKMLTTKGESRFYFRWGTVTFQVEGQETSLTLFRIPGELEFFIPFMDSTNGHETYSGGRYLEASPLPNDTIEIDFNDAYNPYCAYNEPESLSGDRPPRTWSCPIPPNENRLTVPILAGEKNPTGVWVYHDGIA